MRQRALGPNDLLRQARRSTPSPTGSGLPMSRQELAEAINTHLWNTRQRVTTLDGRYVGKLERGEHRWPQADYRQALRTILHAPTDATLGFYATRQESNGMADGSTPAAVPRSVTESRSAATHWLTADPEDGDGSGSSSVGDGLAVVLRRGLLNHHWAQPTEPIPLSDVEAGVHAACVAYQGARYHDMHHVPQLIADSEHLAVTCDGQRQLRAYQMVVWANLVASKLAAKLGDGHTAWLAGDRAASWAAHLDDPALAGVAAYQITCGLGRTPNGEAEAEDLAMTAADRLASRREATQPVLISVRGALLLQAAVLAARAGRANHANHRLATAETLAQHLGRDDNLHWTGFGPTNVLLHRLAVAVALRQLTQAVDLGERLDTSRLPTPLVSRRAQLHLDLAHAHSLARQSDASAMLHLLEAERIAPQTVRRGAEARALITTLLRREKHPTAPGLRPLAHRVGIPL